MAFPAEDAPSELEEREIRLIEDVAARALKIQPSV